MRLTVHPDAERDLEDAAAWYAREGTPALAARFVREFRRVCALIQDHPDLGSKRAQGRRGFPLRHFPYTVIYSLRGDELRVLVVKHDRLRPGFGTRRS
jgi:toxin ParE1/3/4